MKKYLLFLFSYILFQTAFAQCPLGQTNVRVIVTPDYLGSEITWVLKYSASQTIIGQGGPYPNGNTSSVGSDVCVNNDSNVTFLIFDSGFDGICCTLSNGSYALEMNGDTLWKNGTYKNKDSVSFMAPSKSNDVSTIQVNLLPYMDQTNKVIKGIMVNKGLNTITNMTIHYRINNGNIISQTVSPSNFQKNKTYNYSFATPWIPSGTGEYNVMVWTSNPNGIPDENSYNDVLQTKVYIADHLAPSDVLIEGFTSCTDTLGNLSETILDSLISSNSEDVAALKYHLGFPAPGDDPMYLFNTGLMNARKTYYNLPGNVPRAIMNGLAYSGPAYGISQSAFDLEKIKRGPFDITINENKLGNIITIGLTTDALANLSSTNLKLFAAIIEHPVHFASPPSISNKTDFTYVLRTLLPNSSGETIGPVLAGQQNSFVFNYTVDPALLVPENLKTIVFIQDVSTREILMTYSPDSISGFNHGSTIDFIPKQSGSKGIQAQLFPNPSNGKEIFLRILSGSRSEINLEVRGISGNIVSKTKDVLDPGSQLIRIELEDLPSGIYFVRLESKNDLLTLKLAIIR